MELVKSELRVVSSQKVFGVPVWPFALYGGLKVFWSCNSLLFRFLRNVYTRLFSFKNFLGLGSWAVVTGATDGIGLAYAEQLAKKGMNIVLISRTEEKLVTCARNITASCPGVQVRWIVADFSRNDIYEKIESELKDLDIGVLINNVGMTCGHVEYFWETKHSFVEKMLNVNLISTVMMTHIVMPRMAAKNRGLIVNIASILGEVPPYLFIMYGTTKHYMKYFTYGLQLECARACPGVIVQDICPGFVATKLARLKGKRNLFVPTPDEYVRQSLRTIGLPASNGHVVHGLQHFFARLSPDCVYNFILFRSAEYVRRVDQAALKKMAENTEKKPE